MEFPRFARRSRSLTFTSGPKSPERRLFLPVVSRPADISCKDGQRGPQGGADHGVSIAGVMRIRGSGALPA
jgi:hypothetical protein